MLEEVANRQEFGDTEQVVRQQCDVFERKRIFVKEETLFRKKLRKIGKTEKGENQKHESGVTLKCAIPFTIKSCPPRPKNRIFTKENRHILQQELFDDFPFLGSTKSENGKMKHRKK